MNLRNKILTNQILLDTLFKHKRKNKNFLTLNQNHNAVQPILLFISISISISILRKILHGMEILCALAYLEYLPLTVFEVTF